LIVWWGTVSKLKTNIPRGELERRKKLGKKKQKAKKKGGQKE